MRQGMTRAVATASMLVATLSGCGIGAAQSTDNQSGTTTVSTNQTSTASTGQIGQQAPGFTLTRLHGGTVSLQQLMGGKPILLNAWAAWCGPCQEETPDMISMYQKYRNHVQFVGVNMTSGDNLADAKSFVKLYNVPYPIVLDMKGVFQSSYGVLGFPTTVLVSASGKVIDRHLGLMTTKQLQIFMNEALHSLKA